MKLWKTDTTHANQLEERLNHLESKGCYIKEVIPSSLRSFYKVGDSVDEYIVEMYRIIYTVEEEN